MPPETFLICLFSPGCYALTAMNKCVFIQSMIRFVFVDIYTVYMDASLCGSIDQKLQRAKKVLGSTSYIHHNTDPVEFNSIECLDFFLITSHDYASLLLSHSTINKLNVI